MEYRIVKHLNAGIGCCLNKRLRSRCALLILSLLISPWASALEPVSVQLKWQHQFQFAGYYAAKAKGYYQDAGLDVTLLEGAPDIDPIATVLDGEADFGIANSDLLLRHQKGAPVVALAAIFQHSPLSLAAINGRGIQHVHDLMGKQVMIHPTSVETLAYLSYEGITEQHIERVNHSYDLNDLLSGKVAAMTVYQTDAPYQLALAGADVILFKPSVGGVDFYSDLLFTDRSLLEDAPDRVAAFREATLKGWRYAMDHPEEIIQLTLAEYQPQKSLDELRFEAKMMSGLIRSEMIEPGYMHEGRWQHIADTYVALGLMPADYDLSGFLYAPSKYDNLALLQRFATITLLVVLGTALFATYIIRINRKLAASQAWLKAIVDHAPTALMQLDNQGKVLQWNRQAEQTFGWTQQEVIGLNIFDFMVPPDERDGVQASFDKHAAGASRLRNENWNFTKSGKRILCDWYNTRPSNNSNGSNTMISMAIDITERKQMEQQLRRLAHTDPLTGAYNRAFFYDQFNQMLKLARRQSRGLAVMFVDLDDFKQLNDNFGHASGDAALRIVVSRIRDEVRESDIVARVGGDEFAVLLYDCESKAYAAQIAEKLLKALNEPIPVSEHETSVISASIGISLFPDHGDSPDELLRAADKAMYTIKRSGKGSMLLSTV